MTKSICALTHRRDLSRGAFQRYYEQRHAPLAIGFFAFDRYARNHVVDAADAGFDTISEFWAGDIAALARLMDGPVGETMRADEDRFMDRARIAPAGADEHVISAGAPADAAGLRTAVLLGGGQDVLDAARPWLTSLGQDRPGVSLDIVHPWSTVAFPADAVLWLPGTVDIGPPPAGLQARPILVRHHETPADRLLGTRPPSS